jgi:hypothetical protein
MKYSNPYWTTPCPLTTWVLPLFFFFFSSSQAYVPRTKYLPAIF